MIVPREIFGDGKAEVFGVVDDLKLLAMDIIICHDLITLAPSILLIFPFSMGITHKRHDTLCHIKSKTICGRLPPI
jgi:hypothetical protein